MRLLLKITFLGLFTISSNLNAQITIRENNIIEKAVLKPRTFDSLSNISMQKRFIDYKQFIGYKLFFLPTSKKFKSDYVERINFLTTKNSKEIVKSGKIPFEEVHLYSRYTNMKLKGIQLEQYEGWKKKYENIDKEETNIYEPQFYHSKTDPTDGKISGEIGTLLEKVEGKYFTILDIVIKPYSEKEYLKLEDIEEDELEWRVAVKVTLKNNETNDTIQWNIKQAREINRHPFYLTSYFEKRQKLHLHKNLVAMKDIENLIDVNTGEIVNIKKGQKWNCSEISFTDSKKSKYIMPFYFLKNGTNEINIDLEEIDNEKFITEEEFNRIELEKKKKEEQKIKEEQERVKKEQENIKQHKNYCLNKFGQKLGSYIADNKVIIGMTKEMCETSWGMPIDINRTILRGLTHEQWVYGWATYLYFDNGILTTIQD